MWHTRATPAEQSTLSLSGVPTAGPLLTVSSDPPVGCRDNVGPGNAAGCANSSCTLCPNPSRDATRSIYPTTATTDEPAFRQCASQTQRTRLEIASDSPHREGPPSIARGPCEASGFKVRPSQMTVDVTFRSPTGLLSTEPPTATSATTGSES